MKTLLDSAKNITSGLIALMSKTKIGGGTGTGISNGTAIANGTISAVSGPSSNWAALQKQISQAPTAAKSKPPHAQTQFKRARQKSNSDPTSTMPPNPPFKKPGSVSSRSLVPAASILRSMKEPHPSSSAGPSTLPSKPYGRPDPPSKMPLVSATSGFSPSTGLGVYLLPLPIPAVAGSYASNEPGVSNSAAREMVRKGIVSTAKGGTGKEKGKGKVKEELPVGLGVAAIHEAQVVTGEGEGDDLLLTQLITSATPDPTLYHHPDPFSLPDSAPTSSTLKPRTAPQHPTRKGLAVNPIAEKDLVLLNELRGMVAGRAEGSLSEGKRAPGNYLAIDCEMVGTGPLGSQSVLARVSIVNFHGAIVLDAFVRPKERVTDWRTWVSGIRERDMIGARGFEDVQREVAGLVDGKVLIGHAFENDTKALLLSHPAPLTRDTQTFHALREVAKNKRPGLKKLSELELGIKIQAGAHSSVTDARATMALYRIHKNEWEQAMRHQTDAYYAQTKQVRPGAVVTGEKRKANEVDAEEDDEEDAPKLSNKERKKRKYLEGKAEAMAGKGKTGISSGLSVVVTRPGGKDVAKARGPAMEKETSAEAGNWWEK